jgi:hypothetical protein
MKKKLVKRNLKMICRMRNVIAFDEGISDAGITGFIF